MILDRQCTCRKLMECSVRKLVQQEEECMGSGGESCRAAMSPSAHLKKHRKSRNMPWCTFHMQSNHSSSDYETITVSTVVAFTATTAAVSTIAIVSTTAVSVSAVSASAATIISATTTLGNILAVVRLLWLQEWLTDMLTVMSQACS